MKKIHMIVSAALIFFFGVSALGEEVSVRKKIAVVPNRDNPQISSVLEGVLGESPRFAFFDRRQVPALLKEVEKRQLGLTPEDNSGNIYLMEVDYLVSIENLDIYTFQVTYSSSKKVDWQTNLRARVKAVYLKEGGRTAYYDIKTSSVAGDTYESPKKAINESRKALQEAVVKLFPVEAQLYKAPAGRVNLSSGSSAGIEMGQRYIIKERGQSGSVAEKGFAFIDEVKDEYSGGYLISGGDFKLESSYAVEKQYSGYTLEFYGGMTSYRMDSPEEDHDIGEHDALYGARLLMGNNFQWGIGFKTDWPGPGKFTRISLADLSLRYNFHIVKRLYLFVEGGASLEYAFIRERIRSEKNLSGYTQAGSEDGLSIYDDTRLLSSYTISGNLGAGFKFITGYNTYLFGTVNYTAARDFSSWGICGMYILKSDPKASDLENASIDEYDKYISRFSPGGPGVNIGIGFYF